jgi:hypothetical protein
MNKKPSSEPWGKKTHENLPEKKHTYTVYNIHIYIYIYIIYDTASYYKATLVPPTLYQPLHHADPSALSCSEQRLFSRAACLRGIMGKLQNLEKKI